MSELIADIAVVAPVTLGAAGLQGGGEKYNEQRKKKINRRWPRGPRQRTQPNATELFQNLNVLNQFELFNFCPNSSNYFEVFLELVFQTANKMLSILLEICVTANKTRMLLLAAPTHTCIHTYSERTVRDTPSCAGRYIPTVHSGCPSSSRFFCVSVASAMLISP